MSPVCSSLSIVIISKFIINTTIVSLNMRIIPISIGLLWGHINYKLTKFYILGWPCQKKTENNFQLQKHSSLLWQSKYNGLLIVFSAFSHGSLLGI